MSQEQSGRKPIVSTFRDDPDMLPIIEEFVGELSTRVEELRKTFEAGETDSLRRLAHQLKGAGSGYGYEPITDAAAKLESAIKSMSGGLGTVKTQLEDLIELCQRTKV